MQKRKPGNSNLEGSALGLGCMGMTFSYGPVADKQEMIALAWLLAQKPWIVPTPGTRKLERLDENIGAAAVTLTPDDLREIESVAAKITEHGARYPEHLEQMTGR